MIEATLTDPVDQEIYQYLSLDEPKAFFLFAGAGSGKTRSLVNVMRKFREENVHRLRLAGQKVAIITYTNAACDEIKNRLEYDSSFTVSTIHSFAWEIINPYTTDIRNWLKKSLVEEIKDLEEKQRKGKAGSKAAIDRPRQIEAKRRRLDSLDSIRKFIYSPDGDNTERNSLNHAEVISIAADFVRNRPLLKRILVRKHPILLIDESQDTKKELMEAFFDLHADFSNTFVLGLFGDRMQRIYADGKKDLGNNLPANWAQPSKIVNHRCPRRIITLINKIRSPLGDPEQVPADSNEEGVVRFFLANTNPDLDKVEVERRAAQRMAEVTKDSGWSDTESSVKILTLEHLMAARRGEFDSFFAPLYAVDKFKTSLLNGKLPGISLFSNQVLPLVDAMHSGNQFEIARIVRKYSPLVSEKSLKTSSSPSEEIKRARAAVNSLCNLWDDRIPVLNDILKEVYQSGLFPIPERLQPIAERLANNELSFEPTSDNQNDDRDASIDAWDKALNSTFEEFRNYVTYISDQSRFGTHQGVKGLEFPRVMVILDDEEAGGFLFSYEKLLGAKYPSDADRKNEREGNETSMERTRRLFYVTCSRAQKSLAIIAYTNTPDRVRSRVLEENWFSEDEIISE